MAILTRAHHELYRRLPDECFSSTMRQLSEHCQEEKQSSEDCWHLPQSLKPQAGDKSVTVNLGHDGAFLLNDWSFSQLCRLSGVSKDTVNRLSSETASRALQETLPSRREALSVSHEGRARYAHCTVWPIRVCGTDELLAVVSEFATDFEPPRRSAPAALRGSTAASRTCSSFLIDPYRLGRHQRRKLRPGVLHLELRGRPTLARHPDFLVSGGVQKSYRLGRG